MRCRRLYWGLNGALLLFILAGWLALYGFECLAPVPLGLWPVLVMAGSMSTRAWLAICVAVVLALYAAVLGCLWGVAHRKRFGTVGIVVLLTIDFAVNMVFTVTSWWFLLAVALDIALVALCYVLFRWAGMEP